MNRHELGRIGEEMAADFLRERGITILERNYRNRFGEIDIIAKDNDTLLFIEVKYRKNRSFGYPLEAVNILKQKKIREMAAYYLGEMGTDLIKDIRFDCIGIVGSDIEWIKGAFY